MHKPTRRGFKEESDTKTVVETVKLEDDGSVIIIGVEIRPASAGGEIWNAFVARL